MGWNVELRTAATIVNVGAMWMALCKVALFAETTILDYPELARRFPDLAKAEREHQQRQEMWMALGLILFLLAAMFLAFRIYRTCGDVSRYVKARSAQRKMPAAHSPQSSPFDQMRP